MSQKQKEMFREQELNEIQEAILKADGDCRAEVMHNVLKDRRLSLVTEEEVEYMVSEYMDDQAYEHADWSVANGMD